MQKKLRLFPFWDTPSAILQARLLWKVFLSNPNPCLSTRQKKIFLIQRSRNAWWSRFLDKPTYEATAAAYPVLAPALPIPLYRALKALFETYCRFVAGACFCF